MSNKANRNKVGERATFFNQIATSANLVELLARQVGDEMVTGHDSRVRQFLGMQRAD